MTETRAASLINLSCDLMQAAIANSRDSLYDETLALQVVAQADALICELQRRIEGAEAH